MGRIHPDAEQTFVWHPEYRDIVRPFLTAFDVTYSTTKTRGSDLIVVFYLRAEPFIAELVGLEREVLLVYAPFSQFQARTLKLHDEVLAQNRLRLDPIGTILVTEDPQTQATVQDLVLAEPERTPIVAMSTAALKQIQDANGLRSLLFEQLYQRDLFALESPLRTDTTFFGRDSTVSLLLDRFRSTQNTGLFGLRRIGKTSVLFALARRAESGGIAGTSYLDVSNPGAYQSRWWELLQMIGRAFAEPLGLQRAARSKIRALTIPYGEKDAASHFKADIHALAPKHVGGRLLLLMDEIEYITFDVSPSSHWESDFLPFWQSIRSVHQDLRGEFGFVVAGVNPHIFEVDRVGQFDNPLFSTTRPTYLGPFEVDGVRQMVRKIGRYMGLRCEEALYQRLTDEYGGHPFLVRQACSHLAKHVEQRPADLTCVLFEEYRESIAIALERNVRQILNVLAIWYPQEYELLRLLAQGDRKTFVEFATHSASFTEHVEGYGLVRDARGQAKLRVGLVRHFLARMGGGRNSELTAAEDPESVLAEISRRRNAIEIALREVLRDGLRFAKGRRAAQAALSALPETRRAILAQFDYDKLWNETYFNELIAILQEHWNAFGSFFGTNQAQVVQWLEQINRCRADAHARQLNDDDLAFLRVCFRRMEELLQPVLGSE